MCVCVCVCVCVRVFTVFDVHPQLRLQCLVGIVLLLLAVMLVLSFATVFSEGGLNGALQPDVLLTLQLTVFNVRHALRTRLCDVYETSHATW